MTQIRESTVIELPYEHVLTKPERWLGYAGAAAGSYVVMRDPTSKDQTRQTIGVRWTPTGGAPHPTMGHYSLPFGAAGLAFGTVISQVLALDVSAY